MNDGLRDAVLQKVDLLTLVSPHTAMKRAGNEWKGRCPFHQEKTASFHVNPDKQVYHCHGCKAGGNAIDFFMAVEGMEFKEALLELARRHNVEVARTEGQSRAVGKKDYLYRLNDATQEFFVSQFRGSHGAQAREYLQSRGIKPEIIERFGIGYAPNAWSVLTDKLLAAGAKADQLVALGLIKHKSSGQGYVDTFRHRLMFPLRSSTGRVVGFTGRALAPEDQPKYMNISNSPLFEKGNYLYNLDLARPAIREQGAVICEGQFDVIALAQLGFENAVAPSGTAFTEGQLALLQRHTDEFWLAYDGDRAGKQATWDSGKLLLKAGYAPKVIALPAGKDPGDLLEMEDGASVWKAASLAQVSVAEFWLAQRSEETPDPALAQLRRWIAELRPVFASLPDELSRQDFLKAVNSRVKIGAEHIADILTGQAAPASRGSGRGKAPVVDTVALEREIVRRLLTEPRFALAYTILATQDWFENPTCRSVFFWLRAGSRPSQIIERSEAIRKLATSPPLLQHAPEALIEAHHRRYVMRMDHAG